MRLGNCPSCNRVSGWVFQASNSIISWGTSTPCKRITHSTYLVRYYCGSCGAMNTDLSKAVIRPRRSTKQ